jgi:hypothetical protein
MAKDNGPTVVAEKPYCWLCASDCIGVQQIFTAKISTALQRNSIDIPAIP